MGTPSGMV